MHRNTHHRHAHSAAEHATQKQKSISFMSFEIRLRMESNGLPSCPAFPCLQPVQSGDAIQPPDDADVRAETAVMVTHGALLKSYDANKKSMLPLAMLITPMAPQPSLVLHREPPRCRTCGAAFSFASAFGSFQQMRWHCAFCHTSNSFTSASHNTLPEYSPAMSCVDYTESHINTDAPAVLCAPTVIFCVDSNLRPREMMQVRLQPQRLCCLMFMHAERICCS
jgi:hypothetical protein